ncbi:phage tail-collar fiber domain-containing protein [Enterobacter asburiae]|uniref:phage tail-collar fiber domain-containing protein n=1 Tax=Enterobacter asburiae TaxID=61645 RepID=UPI002075B31C|nr:phage tail protein [Enterobacter asburiae]MCM7566758.1 phage tail protein [Enterobacter asburiae]
MSAKFYTLLTEIGAAKLASAAALGVPLKITQMAVGDGGGVLPTPSAQQTRLIAEKRRADLNMLYIDPQNSSQIIAEQVIPETEGGWWIREVGLFDDTGALIAVGNCPESYKPQLAEGSGRTQTVRMVLITSSTDTITLKIDPAVVLATRKYVDDKVLELRVYVDDLMAKHLAAADPHSQYAPKESPTLTGTPKTPTAPAGTNTTQIASTAFVQAVVTLLNNALGLKAPLANPALTGTPTAPTAAQTANNTQIANTAFVKSAITALVGSTPAALDTLNELAAALGNDPNFATTMTNALAGKMEISKNGADIADVTAFLNNLGLGAGSALPVGVPVPWPLATAPAGWLKCNGAAFTASQYPKLAQAYPALKLPDLRAEFIRGWDDGRGVDSGRGLLSAQGGMSFDHRHWLPTTNGTGGDGAMTAVFIDGNSAMAYYPDGTNEYNPNPSTGTLLQTYTVKAALGSAMFGSETRPRNVAFNYIVRAA